MQFARLKDAIRLCAEAKVTCIIWGHRGIGKSQAIQQLCNTGFKTNQLGPNETPLPIGCIDFRCSQIEASDLRGLPDKSEGSTVFLPPEDLPRGGLTSIEIEGELDNCHDPEDKRIMRAKMQRDYNEGILFLDEPNRAQDDVLQAIFQLILDRRIGQYILPSGWAIAMAANYMEGDYITNGFTDSAMLDRMCHLQLVAGEQTLDDWCLFMADKYGESCNRIIQFCASNIDYMTGQVQGSLGFSIQPSPRSWDMAARVCDIVKEKDYSPEVKRAVLSGLVGIDAANAYEQFSCPVQPRDIVANGIAPYKTTLQSLNRNELMGVSWGFISLVRDKMEEQHFVDLALDLAEVLLYSEQLNDKDVILAYVRALLADDCSELAMSSCITNRELAKQIVNIAEDASLLLKSLTERGDLHKKLSSTGWGESV